MVSIKIGPDDILRWFHALSAGWQIMIALVVLPGIGVFAGWLLRRAWDARQVAFWRDQVNAYEKKKPTDPSLPNAAPTREDLKQKNEQVQARQPRSITQKEHRLMYEVLRVIPAQQKLPIGIAVRPDDSEAGRYAMEFQRLFALAGLDGGI
jgi:hypothetical protein